MAERHAGPVNEPPERLLKPIAPPQRKPMHPLAYALIAMSAVFGGVSAVVLIWQPPPPTPVIVMQVPNAGATAAPENTAKAAAQVVPTGADAQASAGTSAGSDVKQAAPGAAGTAKVVDPKAAPSSTGSANIDMSGFGTQGVGGPSATGPDSAGSGSAGGQLTAAEINGVVAQGQPLIRRKCWQPELDARAGSGPSARVSASVVVGPSGSVTSASASGAEKDYPGLSSCIASRLKGWKFPPSGGSTPVNIPFFFAAQ